MAGNFGIDADLEAKRMAKYDPELERQAAEWVSQVTGHPVGTGASFAADLKSGVVLCELINKLAPGSVKKINQQKMAAFQMENLQNFQSACRVYGLKDTDLFGPPALYEEKDMNQVIQTIHCLGGQAQKKGFSPAIGVKAGDAAPRQFDQATLDAGKTMMTKVAAGSTGGANASGMFDSSRQIVKPGGQGSYQ